LQHLAAAEFSFVTTPFHNHTLRHIFSAVRKRAKKFLLQFKFYAQIIFTLCAHNFSFVRKEFFCYAHAGKILPAYWPSKKPAAFFRKNKQAFRTTFKFIALTLQCQSLYAKRYKSGNFPHLIKAKIFQNGKLSA
jgi:hypothetical protein